MTDEEALADLERRRAGFSVYPAGATKTFQLGAHVLVKGVGGHPGGTGVIVNTPGPGHVLYAVLLDTVREKLKSMTQEERALAEPGVICVAPEALESIPPDRMQC